MIESTVEGFPQIIAGSGDLSAYVAANKIDIDAALAKTGAVLMRGFDVPTVSEFDAVVGAYDEPNFPYKESLSNAVRVNLTPRVFTANEAPPTTSIHLHHEMAQTPIYPSKLFFYCEIAPAEGGATPLCRSDVLIEQLAKAEPGVVNAFEMLGVRYTNVMPSEDDAGSGQGRSWRSTLGVDDRSGAEQRLRSLEYTWEWGEDDSLRATTPTLPAVRGIGRGRKSFFNQLIAAFRGWSDSRNDPSKSVTFGDGTPITGTDMAKAIEIADAISYDHQWQAGDVVLVDNFTVMHGRKPFTGKRKVLASLIQ